MGLEGKVFSKVLQGGSSRTQTDRQEAYGSELIWLLMEASKSCGHLCEGDMAITAVTGLRGGRVLGVIRVKHWFCSITVEEEASETLREYLHLILIMTTL